MSKAKIKKTGEIVDVICYGCLTSRGKYDRVSYIDSKGVEHEEEHLNYYWDFEEIPNLDATIDWEQRKFDVAKMLLLRHINGTSISVQKTYIDYAIGNALKIATEFIDKYKETIKL